MKPFSVPVKPNGEEFLQVIRREKTPSRVYHVELFHDGEIQAALNDRFDIYNHLDEKDPHYGMKRAIAFQRFMGYEYVYGGVGAGWPPVKTTSAPDSSSELNRASGRGWMDEGKGIISNWEDFEKYPWEEFEKTSTAGLEWLEKNLPDDMIIIGTGVGNFCEYLCWLFGYETLCFLMFEDRDLVLAVKQKLEEAFVRNSEMLVQFDRVKALWGFDDMGFKTGLMLGTPETRALVLPGHRMVAKIAREAGRPYLMHNCGNLSEIIEDLIEMGVDAKHSFEDTIEDVRQVKHTYGKRMTMLGGIDVDFLCRSTEEAIRKRVRETCEICLPGGGWMLGTGNSVANYIPIDSYLAMVDEGRRYSV